MDSEEFEQIPWSSLMPESAQRVDRRVYIAVSVVGLIVAIVFGTRIVGGSQAQPQPLAAAPVTSTLPQVAPTTTAGLIVSEADLMAGPPPMEPDTLGQAAFAEWFVTDYFTVDGSSENERSLRELLAPQASDLVLPPADDPAVATTYVEWARSVDVRSIGDGSAEVDVVYRTITRNEEGFVRDPVSAVAVTMRMSGSDAGILGLPVPIDVPLPGNVRSEPPIPGTQDR